jgi:hypothetical protein
MRRPHQVLPQSTLTCLEFQETILANLSQQACETTLSLYRDTAVIEMFSFCGCSGGPQPNGCPFCDGNMNFPDSTCTDLAELAQFVADPEYCMEYIQFFEDSCCPANVETVPDVSCSICPPGSRMKNPLRTSVLLGSKTCASIDSELSLVPEDICSNRLDELSHGLDLASFCSCQGMEPPSVFSFCDGGDVVVFDPNTDIVAPHSASGEISCQEALELAPYFASLDSYGNELGSLAGACCQRQQTCSICSDGSSVKFPERPLEFGRSRPSCDALEISLATLSSEECLDIREFNSPVDYESWCGCADALVPDHCSLCREGKILINENVEIPDTTGMTCGDAAEYALHVLHLGYCEEIVDMLSGECCALAPAETGRGFPEVFVVSVASKNGILASNYLSLLAMSLFGILSL